MRTRLGWLGASLLSFAMGSVAVIGLLAADESTRKPHALSGTYAPFVPWVVLLAASCVLGTFGRSVAPSAVVERGRAAQFATAFVLVGLAVGLAFVPSLLCVTWPLVAVFGAVGVVAFVRLGRDLAGR